MKVKQSAKSALFCGLKNAEYNRTLFLRSVVLVLRPFIYTYREQQSNSIQKDGTSVVFECFYIIGSILKFVDLLLTDFN